MSSGQDLSPLFPDVLKLMSSKDLKLKKLIYIFVTQNAQQSKQLALLTVNALQMDANDQDTPIIRAQAIRAMGSVATEEIADYFVSPITNALNDSDPYVRKCAVSCIAQLYAAKKQTVIENGLLQSLRKAIYDGNQAVVSAAATTLVTIAQQVKQDELEQVLQVASLDTLFNYEEVNQLLLVISNATEWSGLNLLNAISRYGIIPQGEDYVIALQRLQPFLKQQNPAVVLCTINIMIRYLKQLQNLDAQYLQIFYDCVSSIISIISGTTTPEIQFVALRSLRLIAKAFPQTNPFSQVQKHIRIFFSRFNDPVYIKLEKVEVLSMITQEQSVYEVVKELADQCEDVQPDYVRACIRCIGQLACRLPSAADYCIDTFMKLLTGYTQQERNELTEEQRENQFRFILPSYAAQELLVTVQQIFRSYPNRYEGIIGDLCESISSYDNIRAKASLIWILGEYCQRIDDVADILCDLLDIDLEDQQEKIQSLLEETPEVQLAILTAVTRIYLSTQNDTSKKLFEKTLKTMKEAVNQDVRTRSSFLDNLVKADQSLQLAYSVVFVEKPTPIFSDGLSEKVSEQLSNQLGSVSATLREIVQLNVQQDEDVDQVVQKFDVTPDVNQLEQNIRIRKALQEEQNQQKLEEEQKANQEQINQEQENQNQEQQKEQKQEQTQEVQQQQQVEKKQQVEDDIFADIFGSSAVAKVETPKVPVMPQQIQQEEVQQQQPQQQEQKEEQPVQEEQPQQKQEQEFPMFENIPIRVRDPATPLKIEAQMTRKNNQPVLGLRISNMNQFAISGAIITISPNVFGFQPQKSQLPIIPAMGIANSGNFIEIPLIVSGVQCSFPASFMQIDDNGSKGMNVMGFNIKYGDIQYQFQIKVPYQVSFTNSGLYHQNGQLVDQFQANMDYNSAISSLKSKQQRFDVQYTASQLHQKLLQQNCQYIGQFGNDQGYCVLEMLLHLSEYNINKMDNILSVQQKQEINLMNIQLDAIYQPQFVADYDMICHFKFNNKIKK